jgi:outer membrane receptor protein involved in Fe transport
VSVWIAVMLGLSGLAAAEDDSDVEEIVVVQHRGLPSRDEAASQTVSAEEAASVPGVQGDAIKAVRILGGVSRPAPGASGVVVWGAAPADTRLFVDDIPVPRLFHLGGQRSILPTPAVSSVTVIPGAPSARYGRGLGGVVAVETQAPDADPVGALAALDPIDLAVSGHTRLDDRTWMSIGVRKSLLRSTIAAIAPTLSTPLIPIPDYDDVQVRGAHRLSNGDELSVLALVVDDRVVRGIPSVTPDMRVSEENRSMFGRAGARLTRRSGENLTVISGWIGLDEDTHGLDFGHVTAMESADSWLVGGLLSATRDLGPGLALVLGMDAQARQTETARNGAVSLPAREGDIHVFGQPPGNRVNADTWRVRQAEIGTFASARVELGAGFVVEPGVRFEPSVVDGDRVLPVRLTEPAVGTTSLQVALDPRLHISYSPVTRVRIYGAVGRVHQPASPADLSPVFGSPTLTQARANHLLGGVVARPMTGLDVEAVVFAMAQRDLAVRSPVPTPPMAGLLVSQGWGRNRGAQLTVRGEWGPVMTRAAYTWTDADRRSRERDLWRPFDLDQTQGLQAAASWSHDAGLSMGARFAFATGLPVTPVVGAVFDTTSQRYDPMFGAHNGERLPTIASVSVRVAYGRPVRWGQYLLWLDVLNAANQVHVEAFYYSADYAHRDVIRGLPILPVVGLEVSL